MNIRIVQKVYTSTYNKDGSNPQTIRYNKGEILEVESIEEYTGRYSPCTLLLYRVNLLNGKYVLLTKGVMDILSE